ncbi:hypothetical protein mRhiFer1_008762 [Rhinolophus ferrumequinum]|uniref:Uncharacterized protein n=1 Tax=Rhinolophus ferrumequinum TaxID=59479 RepID=A0A7J7TMC2_RHIFE|nr:hypothetical protein mRhiFer1_008762 [Rhinolophus ferrumequinum]
MNRTLKETLSKLAIETGGDWVTLLPYAIFRVRNSPYVHVSSLYEIKDAPNPEHGIVPGDWVWVDGIGPWVHHSHVRRASQLEQTQAEEWTVRRHPDNPLKLQLSRPRGSVKPPASANNGMAASPNSAQHLGEEPRGDQPTPTP